MFLWQLSKSSEVDLQPEAISPQQSSTWRTRRLQQSQSCGHNPQRFHGFCRPRNHQWSCALLPSQEEGRPRNDTPARNTGMDSFIVHKWDTALAIAAESCLNCLLSLNSSCLSVMHEWSGAKWRILKRNKKTPTSWPTTVCRLWKKYLIKSSKFRSNTACALYYPGYLKLWQLQIPKPQLSDQFDAIFIDEAQDCTPGRGALTSACRIGDFLIFHFVTLVLHSHPLFQPSWMWCSHSAAVKSWSEILISRSTPLKEPWMLWTKCTTHISTTWHR